MRTHDFSLDHLRSVAGDLTAYARRRFSTHAAVSALAIQLEDRLRRLDGMCTNSGVRTRARTSRAAGLMSRINSPTVLPAALRVVP